MKELQIEYLPTEELIPYENNPRHNDEAVEYVANSIKDFGFKVPIVIDANNVIVSGHTRLKAAKRLGIEKLPCIRADDLTEEQIKAFRLADNKVGEIATWDTDKLMQELADIAIDMEAFGFGDITEPEIEIPEDDFDIKEDEKPEPETGKGEIYRLGDHILMCGDSTSVADVAALMDGQLADCVITDPPYNVAYEGGTEDAMTIENDNLEAGEFAEFLGAAFANMANWLKPGGAFYVWYASRNHIAFEEALNENGLEVREQLIWVKNSFVLGRQDYQWMHEPCMYGWKAGEGHYFVYDRTQPTAIEYPEDLDKLSREELLRLLKETPSTVIHENKPPVNDIHPTMKPLKLIGKLVRNSTQPGDTVLDLFGGGGSTLIACEELGRKCRMMELDPVYADAIIHRWEEYTGKKAVRIRG